MIVFRRSKPSLSRRFCTVLAALGLLFAATVASVAHSIAMPLPAMMPAAMDHAGHDAMAQDPPSHDHGCDSAASDNDPAMPMSPCENGCLLCKSCSLASAVMPLPSALAAAAPYDDYGLSVAIVPASLTPNPPNEPPRL